MKIEKVDKWLDDKYGISYTELVKIKEYLAGENERLIIRALNNYGRVPEQHELLDEIETLKQELQRKDNIINELEKIFNYDIKKSQEYMNKFIGEVHGDYSVHYYRAEWQKEKAQGYLDKLKELKEGK